MKTIFLLGKKFGKQDTQIEVSVKAFTLAEVLITLIIVGVVAAITVPILRNDTADKKWNVARQKAQATIGEAFKLMTVNGEITDKLSTAEFAGKIIPKYLKIEKTCSPNNFSKCGFPSTVKTPDGKTVNISPKDWKWSELSGARTYITGTYTDYSTTHSAYDKNYFFRTLDGFSVSFFYNPYCAIDHSDIALGSFVTGKTINYQQQSIDVTCLMGVYDMNGSAKPNQVGKDIGFVGSFYNGYEAKSAAVLPHNKIRSSSEVVPILKNNSGNNDYVRTALNYCENLDKDKNWTLPDINELTLVFLNSRLVLNAKGLDWGQALWSKTLWSGSKATYKYIYFKDLYGTINYHGTMFDLLFLCVRS